MDGSVHPIRATRGLRPISTILPSVIGNVFNELTSYEPLYFVRDGKIVHRISHRAMSVAEARRKLQHYVDDALIVPQADLVDIDIIGAVHLIHAIREAEGTDPVPPAQAERVAA